MSSQLVDGLDGLLQSSMWTKASAHTRIIWITIIGMSELGEHLTVGAVADRAGLSPLKVHHALEKLFAASKDAGCPWIGRARSAWAARRKD